MNLCAYQGIFYHPKEIILSAYFSAGQHRTQGTVMTPALTVICDSSLPVRGSDLLYSSGSSIWYLV